MESPHARPRRERWSSELPQEIIRSIAKLLENDKHDLLHFRMVCKNWRRSTALSALLPETSDGDDDPYLFSSTAYLLQPPATSNAAPSIVCSFETSKGNLQFRCPFSRTPLQNMPKHFNPENFDFCILAVSYHLFLKSKAAYYCEKVVVSSTHQLSRSINDCAVVGLHDGGQLGGYPPSRHDVLEDEFGVVPWVNTFSILDEVFIDDVVRFRGMILALDRQGCVYEIDHYTLKMARVFVNRGVSKVRAYKTGWRKRLVGTSAGQLYLVVRQNERTKKPAKGTNKQLFKVYELSGYDSDSDSPCRLHEWVEVEGFGDQVMFVFRDYSFFASADEFPRCQLRNCMVYSTDSFHLHLSFGWEYFDEAWGGIINIGVFRLGPQRGNFLPASLYPDFPESLWSPPSWVLQHNPTQRIQYDSNNREGESNHEEEDEATIQLDPNGQDNDSHHEEAEVEVATMQVDSNNQGGASFHEEVTPPPPPSTNGARHEVREDSQTDTKEETIHSVTTAYITSSSTSDTSTVQFKGFNISSTLVATLQSIWSKHGNIVSNSIIRNGEILARSLESLANMVRILKDSTNGSLDDSVADYLNTTLSDLQHMHFEVDWLVPFVKKALDYHKSKPLVDSLKELGDAKARTRELRSKLGNDLAKVDEMEREVKARAAEMRSELDQKLAKLDEVEKELEQDITVLSEMIPFSGELNFDELL